MPSVTSEDPCLCCDKYKRLIDCCTDDPANYVISAATNASVVLYGGRCYYIPPDATLYTHDEAIGNGWAIITTGYSIPQTGYGEVPGCDFLADCHVLFLNAALLCWDTGDDEPHTGYFGPCLTTFQDWSDYQAAVSGKAFQYDGKWWIIGNSPYAVTAVRLCDYATWYAANSGDIISDCPLTLTDPPDDICCHLYQEPDSGPSHSCEVPCTVYVTPGNFTCDPSWCGPTDAGWDGVCVTDGFVYAGAGGTLPGTSYCIAGIQITWNWTTGKWELNLADSGYFWTGDGPSDPCDPRGTYTFVARYSLPAPGCSSSTAGGTPTQTGTGPTTITVT